MKDREYSCNEEINRELEECKSRLAHTQARRAELEKKRESIHKSMHGLLADYMERLETEEEKWRDEIARLECERIGRES